MTLRVKDSVYALICFTFSHVSSLFVKTMLQVMIQHVINAFLLVFAFIHLVIIFLIL